MRATDMLRFGYLLANGGRWRDMQVIPRDYVLRCGRQSPYNPHFPYSLQFDVNTGGAIQDLPRDAFWKTGSGGHALYVVPSLNLVVWKLGGRDGQYSTGDTGLKPSPASPQQIAERAGVERERGCRHSRAPHVGDGDRRSGRTLKRSPPANFRIDAIDKQVECQACQKEHP